MTTVTYKGKLTTNEPHKALVKGGKRDVGRNNAGRISVRHKGGGHKRLFRDVDFFYNKQVPAARGDYRVRSEPLRLHRRAGLPRRRAPATRSSAVGQSRRHC